MMEQFQLLIFVVKMNLAKLNFIIIRKDQQKNNKIIKKLFFYAISLTHKVGNFISNQVKINIGNVNIKITANEATLITLIINELSAKWGTSHK